MSRTNKDLKVHTKYRSDDSNWYPFYYCKENDTAGCVLLKTKGRKPKLPKHKDTEWHWMTTPSWWTNLFMNRPQRHKANTILRTLPQDLEDAEVPNTKKKPHVYYW